VSHDDHASQPGYHPSQVLKDGCGECAYRSTRIDAALDHLDPQSFAEAWDRAATFGRGGLTHISDAELSLLRVLYAVQVQLERAGLPFGISVPAFSSLLLQMTGAAS
jgi:hypothetical protein